MSELESAQLDSSNNKILALEELAHQLESLPLEERYHQWQALAIDDKSGVLPYFHIEPRKSLFEQCSEQELLELGLQLSE